MWGTHNKAKDRAERGRFIPTHVGNTASPVLMTASTPVHPHACGEHTPPGANIAGIVGSSPRMWGTQHQKSTSAHGNRFIPTHVGNTMGGSQPRPTPAVHPHACGEHTRTWPGGSATFGSSPRMWGTQYTKVHQRLLVRFIPTHVGNTAPVAARWRVHHGSSPRMWGTRLPESV